MRQNYLLMRTLLFNSTWALILPILLSCESEPPEHPPLASIDWKEFTHPTLGYSIKYPSFYKVREHDADVMFRFDNYPVLVINYVDEQEARDRGLWAKHKSVDSMMVDNRFWRKYVYTHYDIISGMRTVSYVTNFKEKMLGIEFRTSGEMGPVQEEILNSIKFQMIDLDR